MNSPPFFTILDVFVFLGALGLLVQAVIGLSFFISSVWEKERRATLFAAVQFGGMMVLWILYLLLVRSGFFQTFPGIVMLIVGYIVVVAAAVFLVRRTAPNQRALQGASGYVIGKINRFDERMQVFARNRALRPGSKQHQQFYTDDIFYGRVPKPNDAPIWARFKRWKTT